jgi:hypothetical protein
MSLRGRRSVLAPLAIVQQIIDLTAWRPPQSRLSKGLPAALAVREAIAPA